MYSLKVVLVVACSVLLTGRRRPGRVRPVSAMAAWEQDPAHRASAARGSVLSARLVCLAVAVLLIRRGSRSRSCPAGWPACG